ncbi:unnamed protein product [Adineta ricciae]|uniref:Uncharacterized protein n=1 Tax=Adineta ricciae TaxID=249248 RepID=A0A813R8Y5_ADIRI|nr:unnamed protein product [Adineta ricciae]CAF1186150.1 unnamed protein product [Adineta ricciae]
MFLTTIALILSVKLTPFSGNLLRNSDFSQVQTNGKPNYWNVTIQRGNAALKVLPRKYLALNVFQISAHINPTALTFTQMIRLEQNTNKRFLYLSFWYKTLFVKNSASVRFEFYNQSNVSIMSEYIKSLFKNSTWTYHQITKPIPSKAVFGKFLLTMNRSVGTILLANISIEQANHWWNSANFFVSPRSDGTLFIRWNFTNNTKQIAFYEIYRGKEILSTLNTSHLLVTIPVIPTYGKNIYESMYTDHTVHLSTIYTYQVIARYLNRSIVAQTELIIGQADLTENYYTITTLIALPRVDGIHLSWQLDGRSTAKYIVLYNGIDHISDVNSTSAQILGVYAVQEMKTIVPWTKNDLFLLVSDDGNQTATAKLADLTRSRVVLTSTRLAFIREQIDRVGHAQEVFKALIKSVYSYKPDSIYSYCWLARDAALLYAITKNKKYINLALAALEINSMNYTIYDNSAIKLRFAFSTMARAQVFDWIYDGLNREQRQFFVRDFQYTASIFASYSDDHSRNPNDKASNWVAIIKSAELIQHLTLYGEEEYPHDQAERRILFLFNELQLHLGHAYGPSGYTQEGLNYLAYTIPILAPAIYLTKDMGLSIFDDAWSRPDWHNLALHIISFRKERNALQFGVSTPTYAYNGLLPYIFNSTTDPNVKAALKWFYDRTMGMNSSPSAFDGKDKCAALFYYPYDIPEQSPHVVFPRSTSMIVDNIEGFYVFRNRYQDQNDVLVALVNRNRRRNGWNANETFALSIISHDTTWARMPGKEFIYSSQTKKFSTPLIDGWPREPSRNHKLGYTTLVKPFQNQGGGYVSLDASNNFNISCAQRSILVDMIKRNRIETIIALQDHFIDVLSHAWHWQLSPNPEETNITVGYENNLSIFIIRGRNQCWLKGWLYNYQNATYNNTDGVLRIIKYGSSANFKIAMALGSGIEPTASRTTDGLKFDTTCVNFNTLSNGIQCPTTTHPFTTRWPILLIVIATILTALSILILIGILMRRIIKRYDRVDPITKINSIDIDKLASLSKINVANQTRF